MDQLVRSSLISEGGALAGSLEDFNILADSFKNKFDEIKKWADKGRQILFFGANLT